MSISIPGSLIDIMPDYVGNNKDIGKRLPHLHYIKMKICYDPCFIDISVTIPWQHYDAITFFTCLCISRYKELFFRIRLRELVPPLVASVVAKFEQVL